MGDRIELHEPLQPVRHRLHRNEGVGEEGEREEHDHRDPLHTGSRTSDYTEEGEDPTDRPGAANHNDSCQYDMLNAPGWAIAHDIAHDEGQHRGDGVADSIRQQGARQRSDSRDRQRFEAIEHPFIHILPKLNASYDGSGDHRLDENAGDDDRQIIGHIPRDRPAENICEHESEQNRLKRNIE